VRKLDHKGSRRAAETFAKDRKFLRSRYVGLGKENGKAWRTKKRVDGASGLPRGVREPLEEEVTLRGNVVRQFR